MYCKKHVNEVLCTVTLLLSNLTNFNPDCFSPFQRALSLQCKLFEYRLEAQDFIKAKKKWMDGVLIHV